jgi:type VI secretion system protein ImpG
MIERYFAEEMRYLRQAGREYAIAHPEQARYLNIDSLQDRDPYVERLFEGFAFLSGRIHERLDDDLPQFAQSLCNALFPHFLRPIPSLSLVEFRVPPGAVRGTVVLPKGTQVLSAPAGDEKTECRFATTHEVRLQAVSLARVQQIVEPDGVRGMQLTLKIPSGADFAALDLKSLRLYFRAEAAVAAHMHLYCTRHVEKVVLSQEGDDAPVTLAGQEWITPGGLGEDESLLPFSATSFSGLRLLQEYLNFREKFWCVDLHGLDRFKPSGWMASDMTIRVHFVRQYPDDKPFTDENVRLNCSPVVNLFHADAEPIRVEHRASEYTVVASHRQRGSVEVYDVERVNAVEDGSGRRYEYAPYYSGRPGGTNGSRYYTKRRRFGINGRFETVIALETEPTGTDTLRSETLSMEVRCTNGTLPRERLHEGSLNRLGDSAAIKVQPHNFSQPTRILYPPLARNRDFLWKLISHWSLNFRSIATAESLRSLLALYDWTDSEGNRRRLGGIQDVVCRPKEVMHRGGIVRGSEITLILDEQSFGNDGEACLFGLVMSRFFGLYATINSFVHVAIELLPSGRLYRWEPKQGARAAL